MSRQPNYRMPPPPPQLGFNTPNIVVGTQTLHTPTVKSKIPSMVFIKHNTMFTFIYNGKQYRAKTYTPLLNKIIFIHNDDLHISIYKNLKYDKYWSWLYDPKIIKLRFTSSRNSKHYQPSHILGLIKYRMDEILEARLKQELTTYKSEFGEIDTL